MKALTLLAVLLVSAAACATASPPRGFPLTVVDTGVVSVTCPPAGPNTGCLVSVADSISGQVIWANQAMTIGQTLNATVSGVPGQRMVIKGTMVGVAPNVPNSAPALARAEGMFPYPGAQTPVWTIQFVFPGRP